ncbi:hypothetical protein NX059_002962 [Plenodomus lindquistii]|nr:hypothetical protein NX059_002962 [Plenodomus lindquistii]
MFHVSELPKTFQDAVRVTRAVGIPYLWIDSICIIQYGDNKADWDREAARMKDVYSGAYCTIAATAAKNSHSGFLDRQTLTEYVCVHDNAEKQFFLSTDIDDFDCEVVKAPLNSRAWVFQESVLSRRTIHFSANQMYWECGEGIYCENLTKLKGLNADKYFTMDPEYPARLLCQSSNSPTLAFEYGVIFLIEEYSKRQLTFAHDRPIAIAGLEQRLTDAFHCESRFGVLESSLHHTLLWYPSGHKPADLSWSDTVPSWSWMACPGAVTIQKWFHLFSVGNAEYESFWQYWKQSCREGYQGLAGMNVNTNVSFRKGSKTELSADLAVLVDCTIHWRDRNDYAGLAPEFRHALRGTTGKIIGYIVFDAERIPNLDNIYCVILAKISAQFIPGFQGDHCLVMIVSPTGKDGAFRRIGCGSAPRDNLVRLENNVRII